MTKNTDLRDEEKTVEKITSRLASWFECRLSLPLEPDRNISPSKSTDLQQGVINKRESVPWPPENRQQRTFLDMADALLEELRGKAESETAKQIRKDFDSPGLIPTASTLLGQVKLAKKLWEEEDHEHAIKLWTIIVRGVVVRECRHFIEQGFSQMSRKSESRYDAWQAIQEIDKRKKQAEEEGNPIKGIKEQVIREYTDNSKESNKLRKAMDRLRKEIKDN